MRACEVLHNVLDRQGFGWMRDRGEGCTGPVEAPVRSR